MKVDFSQLNTAADKWDEMAGEFKKLEDHYRDRIQNVSLDGTWTGQASLYSRPNFATTRHEYASAQVEAKAVASLLRDAYAHFIDLKKKVEHARQDAIDAGMKVSEAGVASIDFSKLSPAGANAVRHDPDAKTIEASWTKHINDAVVAVDEADQALKTALEAAVADTDFSDGTLNGFNAHAEGSLAKAAAAKTSQTGTRTDGWTADGKATATGPGVGASTSGPQYGKEGSAKVYADLGHATAKGSLTNGEWKLSGIADIYGGARATANYGLSNKGAVGKAEVSAGMRGLAEGRAEYGDLGGVYGRAEGFAGAEAGVNAKATKDEVTVGVKAFAGRKGSVAGGVEFAGIGIGGTAEAGAGAGAEAWWGVKKDEHGAWHLGGDAFISDVVGAGGGVEITFDPHKFGKAVGGAADAVGGAVGGITGSMKHTVSNWL
ncbi:hypothetical protein [Streptomyces sp. NPDC023838]|uniref:hypothetical protein n=1 Tax=Streptomyces sp. NPDC023838 TaxID=3154325 RepID=UPI00340304CC